MLKAIIIDDEPYCCEILAAMLEADCPRVQVVAVCKNGEEGLAAIREFNPNLVFFGCGNAPDECIPDAGAAILHSVSPDLYHLLRSIRIKSYSF